MEAEIVYSGLCSFLNVRNNHGDQMPEPSVILVRADVPIDPDEVLGPRALPHKQKQARARTIALTGDVKEATAAGAEHIPYIAFDTATTVVDSDEGFQPVPMTDEQFLYFRLPVGVEIRIPTLAPGDPTIDPSYDQLAKKDEYWPEAKDQWNRDYVPFKGGLPKPSVVVAFMRFGQGILSASRLCPAKWEFPKVGGGVRMSGQFAEEAIYSGFAHDGTVVMELVTLEEPRTVVRTLRFTPIDESVEKLSLFIGNDDRQDMDNAVQRRQPISVGEGDHFKFLNKVASIKGGPVPRIDLTGMTLPKDAGGGSAGACGPHSSDA